MTEPLPGQLRLDGGIYRPTPKFLAFGDVHLGTHRVPIRWATLEAMAEIELIADRVQPDVILFAGDAFQHAVPSARDVAAFGHFLANLANIAEVIMVPGNHDIAGHDSSAIDVFHELEGVTVAKHPKVIQRKKFQLCCIPWLPSKALSTLDLEAQSTKGVIQALVQIIKAKLDPNKYAILLGHLTTLNAKFHEKAYTILSDDVLWTQDMFEGFDVSILGHIHRKQEPHPGVYYTGSVVPMDFGEAGQEKCVIVGGEKVAYKKLSGPDLLQIKAEEIHADFAPYNSYVQVVKQHGEPDPEPFPCIWYEVVTDPPKRDFRQRLGEEAIGMAPEEALTRWLELERQDPEAVLKLARELMEAE